MKMRDVKTVEGIDVEEIYSCPQPPAKILLDDTKQVIIENVGFSYGTNLYNYLICDYPQSHHTE